MEELEKRGNIKLCDFLRERRDFYGRNIEQMARACDMPIMMYKQIEDGYVKLEETGKGQNIPYLMAIARGCGVGWEYFKQKLGKSFY